MRRRPLRIQWWFLLSRVVTSVFLLGMDGLEFFGIYVIHVGFFPSCSSGLWINRFAIFASLMDLVFLDLEMN